MGEEGARRAADMIADHRLRRSPLPALPEDCRPQNEQAAYDVQARLHERLMAAGLGPVAGHKIGCTTPVMQAFLGIDNPCAGAVFAPTVRELRGVFRHADFLHVGVECEIAVRLSADITPDKGPYDENRVATAVAACMAAIEVVDDRYVDYRRLDTPTLIADDFFDAGCVLGAPLSEWDPLDLAKLAGRMTINGVEVGRGVGADIMRHPLSALAWLANHRAARGESLRAGTFVLLGSLVETKWVQSGDEVAIAIEGLGEAFAHFA